MALEDRRNRMDAEDRYYDHQMQYHQKRLEKRYPHHHVQLFHGAVDYYASGVKKGAPKPDIDKRRQNVTNKMQGAGLIGLGAGVGLAFYGLHKHNGSLTRAGLGLSLASEGLTHAGSLYNRSNKKKRDAWERANRRDLGTFKIKDPSERDLKPYYTRTVKGKQQRVRKHRGA